MHRLALCILLTLVFVTTQTLGQTNPPPQSQKPDPNNPWAMWDIQQMIQRASSEVTKRYNLTPEQTEFTRNLMATRVNGFLDRHEQKIREIFAEIIKYQMAGQAPPADKVQKWTDDITPMFDEAKVQIIEGNKEFREVLTDDQKKIHDIDLKVMEQNFADAQKRLERWQQGGFDPAKDMGQPPAKPGAAKPVTASGQPAAAPVAPAKPSEPMAPAAGGPSAPQASSAGPKSVPLEPTAGATPTDMDSWEAYVRQFIADYKLDNAQSNQALGILAETKRRASEYRASRKSDYQKYQTVLASDPQNTEVAAQLKELDKPIGSLFTELKLRLDQIPTDSQRKAYEQAKGSKAPATTQAAAEGWSANGKATTSRPTGSRPIRPITSHPTVRPMPRTTQTRPAASQPAAQR